VLSWSFIEAMACGCLMIGSSTPPVLEVLSDGVNGFAVDFFDSSALAARIDEALQQPQKMQRLRNAARATAVERFDLKRVVLPQWLALFEDLTQGRRPKSLDARMNSRRPRAHRGRGQAAG
jgi:glycosyltransferase involved in cell wall biosynthesis